MADSLSDDSLSAIYNLLTQLSRLFRRLLAKTKSANPNQHRAPRQLGALFCAMLAVFHGAAHGADEGELFAFHVVHGLGGAGAVQVDGAHAGGQDLAPDGEFLQHEGEFTDLRHDVRERRPEQHGGGVDRFVDALVGQDLAPQHALVVAHMAGVHFHDQHVVAADAVRHDADLVVYDGPLRGRNDPRSVGYVKTQQVQYLPDEQHAMLGTLAPGERTPLMLIGGRGTKYSWYLRLPGPKSQPMSGVVRCELPGVGTTDAAAARADEITLALPRFASEPHKDNRAPQNLYPIAGLENELRRRLGDALLMERALRVASLEPTI
mgnify:CR=1 FL=1